MKGKHLLLTIAIMALVLATMTGCSLLGAKKTVGTAVDGDEVKIEKAAFNLIKAQADAGYQLVDTATLKSWVDSGKDMVVIDTMPNDFYKKGHIPGAVNAEMPITVLADATAKEKEDFEKVLGTDKEKTIVVYCGFTACARSHAGAEYAVELGYSNVYRHPGGIIAWQDAGYATEK